MCSAAAAGTFAHCCGFNRDSLMAGALTNPLTETLLIAQGEICGHSARPVRFCGSVVCFGALRGKHGLLALRPNPIIAARGGSRSGHSSRRANPSVSYSPCGRR